MFCPLLLLGAAGDKITEPVCCGPRSSAPSRSEIREFLAVSGLSPSPALGPLGCTCLALQACRSASSLAYIPLPGAHELGILLLLAPPTTLNHTHPSTACFRPSITSGIWLLTQLPAPLWGPWPGSRTPVNTWLGLRFGRGLYVRGGGGGGAVCPNTGSGPFESLLRLGRRLGARQLSALDWEFYVPPHGTSLHFSFLVCKPEIIIPSSRMKANV